MWKLLFSLVVLLAPASALANCASRVALVQLLLTPVEVEASNAVSDAHGACPSGMNVNCWPMESYGDSVVVARAATLDGWTDEIDVDCTGETDPDVLAWRAAVDARLDSARAQFQYLHDTHVSLVP